MLAQPAMLLPCPALEQEPEHCAAHAEVPCAEGYDGAPGPAERRLAAVFAFGLSATLLASLLALQGEAGAPGEGLDALTTFSVNTSPPAPDSAPTKPPPAPQIQSEPSAEQITLLPPLKPLPRPAVRLPGPALPLSLDPIVSGEASASSASVVSRAVSGAASQGDADSEAEAPARNAAPASISGQASQAETDAYAQSVFDKIRREQRYESILRRDGLTGTVVLAFTIDRRGNLRGQRVALASLHPIIDRIALRHLAEAAPFPRPPRGEERSFQIPLTYRQRE